jgi:hypothetical protein
MTRIIFGDEYRSYNSSLCSLFHFSCYTIPLRLKYLPQHPIPLAKTHVPFPWLTSYKRISPRMKPLCTACKKLIFFYSAELLAPRPNSKLEKHPLLAIRDLLFTIFAATFHIRIRDLLFTVFAATFHIRIRDLLFTIFAATFHIRDY